MHFTQSTFAIAIGWQEIFFLYSIFAMISGGLLLRSSDPGSWRRGGVILLGIPLIFYLLLGLEAAFGPGALRQPWWLLLMVAPWLIPGLRRWSNRERLYSAILLASLGMIAFLFSRCTELP